MLIKPLFPTNSLLFFAQHLLKKLIVVGHHSLKTIAICSMNQVCLVFSLLLSQNYSPFGKLNASLSNTLNFPASFYVVWSFTVNSFTS